MKDDYTTNSRYLTHTSPLQKLGRMYFLNLLTLTCLLLSGCDLSVPAARLQIWLCPRQWDSWGVRQDCTVLENQGGYGTILVRVITTQRSRLKMVTDAVANATKMVRLVTRSFQAVAKLVTLYCRTYQIVTKPCELATKFLVLSRQK